MPVGCVNAATNDSLRTGRLRLGTLARLFCSYEGLARRPRARTSRRFDVNNRRSLGLLRRRHHTATREPSALRWRKPTEPNRANPVRLPASGSVVFETRCCLQAVRSLLWQPRRRDCCEADARSPEVQPSRRWRSSTPSRAYRSVSCAQPSSSSQREASLPQCSSGRSGRDSSARCRWRSMAMARSKARIASLRASLAAAGSLWRFARAS